MLRGERLSGEYKNLGSTENLLSGKEVDLTGNGLESSSGEKDKNVFSKLGTELRNGTKKVGEVLLKGIESYGAAMGAGYVPQLTEYTMPSPESGNVDGRKTIVDFSAKKTGEGR